MRTIAAATGYTRTALKIPRDHTAWTIVEPGGAGAATQWLTDDLLDPLLKCFAGDNRWLEYGVVEHRLHEIALAVFARHVAQAGHHMFGDARETASKNRFRIAIGRLQSEGHLEGDFRKSTGAAWQHDTKISY